MMGPGWRWCSHPCSWQLFMVHNTVTRFRWNVCPCANIWFYTGIWNITDPCLILWGLFDILQNIIMLRCSLICFFHNIRDCVLCLFFLIQWFLPVFPRKQLRVPFNGVAHRWIYFSANHNLSTCVLPNLYEVGICLSSVLFLFRLLEFFITVSLAHFGCQATCCVNDQVTIWSFDNNFSLLYLDKIGRFDQGKVIKWPGHKSFGCLFLPLKISLTELITLEGFRECGPSLF